MANTTDLQPISTATAEALYPGAVAAWAEPAPPAALYSSGPHLLADAADGHPHCWCPELGEWDPM